MQLTASQALQQGVAAAKSDEGAIETGILGYNLHILDNSYR